MGNPVVSRRSAKLYDTPSINSVSNFNSSKVTNNTDSWVKLAFKVRLPIVSDNTITANSKIVFAHANDGPSNSNDLNSDFPFHGTGKGILGPINFLGSGESSEEVDNFDSILIAHGVLFFIAWAVAPFIGIFVARYLKNMMGVWWYRVHVGMFLVFTGLLSLISFILIVSNIEDDDHFEGNHQKLGLVIFIFMFIQIALGYISNWLWSPTRTSIPWWDKVHWYFGRSLVLLAIINIFLGISEYGEISGEKLIGVKVAYWAWIGLAVVVMIAGQIYFGAQQHVEPPTKINEEAVENTE